MNLRYTLTFSILAVALVPAACNTVASDSCWPNTSGGLGGDGPIPIAAGAVGATGTGTGDFISPPSGPLAAGEGNNPCVAADAPRVAERAVCDVTWRAGSDVCGPGSTDCHTQYVTSQKYTSIDDARAECEHTSGVGQGTGAKSCICDWKPVPILPSDAYWHGWCYEGDFKWELWGNFPDKAACVKRVEGSFHCNPGSADCEKRVDVNAVYYCNGDSVCQTTDGPPVVKGGCTYSNHAVSASSASEAVDKANVECAVEFQKNKAPGRSVSCASKNLVCKTGGDAPN